MPKFVNDIDLNNNNINNGGVGTFNQIVISGSVSNDTDVATKAYVDSVATGLDLKDSVRVATTEDLNSNSSISGVITYNATGGNSGRGQITATLVTADTFIVDGVTLNSTDNGTRILVKDQSNSAQNGIYTIVISGTSLTLNRAEDFDEDDEVTSGAFCFVEEGTVNAGSGWVLTTNDPITIGGAGGTSLTFSQFSGAGQIIAGDGLSKSGNTLSIDLVDSDSGLRFIAGELELNLASSGGLTKTGGLQLSSTVAGSGLTLTSGVLDVNVNTTSFTISNDEITLASTVAGDGISLNSGVLSADVDTNSFTTSGGTIALSSGVAGDGLSLTSGVLSVNTDGTTITTSGDSLLVADNGISLAKIASGTSGDLLYWDSAGDPASLAAGTLGQGLRINSSGLPSWKSSVFQEPVKGIAVSTDTPPTEVLGDRYILDNSGAPNAAWDGASQGDIVEFDGTSWVVTYDASSGEGGIVWDESNNILKQYDGSSWVSIDASVTLQEAYNASGSDASISLNGTAGGIHLSANSPLTFSSNPSVLKLTNNSQADSLLELTNGSLTSSILDINNTSENAIIGINLEGLSSGDTAIKFSSLGTVPTGGGVSGAFWFDGSNLNFNNGNENRVLNTQDNTPVDGELLVYNSSTDSWDSTDFIANDLTLDGEITLSGEIIVTGAITASTPGADIAVGSGSNLYVGTGSVISFDFNGNSPATTSEGYFWYDGQNLKYHEGTSENRILNTEDTSPVNGELLVYNSTTDSWDSTDTVNADLTLNGNLTLSGNSTLSGSISTSGSSSINISSGTTLTVQSGGSLAIDSGGTLTITDAPTSNTDAVNKLYADSIAAGLILKQSVRVATTANLDALYNNGTQLNGEGSIGATLTNNGAQSALTIDGVTLSVSDRVIVKNQLDYQEVDVLISFTTDKTDLSGDYITIYDASDTAFHFWFDVTGTDSVPAGATNPVRVDISGDTTSDDVAVSLKAAVNTTSVFSAAIFSSLGTSNVHIINAGQGNVTDASSSDVTHATVSTKYNDTTGGSIANGIYEVTDAGSASTNWVLTRASDADGSPEGEVTYGMHAFVEEGTENNFTGWALYGGSGVLYLGHDEIKWTQFQGLPQFVGGDGINISASVISVDAKQNGGLVFEAGKLALDLGASSITGTLSVADGGTGATSLTDGGILLGSGTNPITVTAQPTDGQLLIGSTGSDPVLSTLSGATNQISITNGPGSISIGISSSYSGQSSITTVGTISSGTWNGSIIEPAYGGTGIDTSSSTGVPYVSSGTWSTEAALDETRGGTGQTSYTTGDLLYASATNTLSKLPAGSLNQKLTMGTSSPEWSTSQFQEPVIATQTDSSLDPGLTPTLGDRYIIENSADLHANFGTIAGVGDDDIVEYDGTNFIVVWDASSQGEGGIVWDESVDTLKQYNGTAWVGIDASVTLQEAYDASTAVSNYKKISVASGSGLAIESTVAMTSTVSTSLFSHSGSSAKAVQEIKVDTGGTANYVQEVYNLGTVSNDLFNVSNESSITSGSVANIVNASSGTVGGSAIFKVSNENTSETGVSLLELNGSAAVASTVPAMKFSMNSAHASVDVQFLNRSSDPSNLVSGGIWYNSTSERLKISDGTDSWEFAQKYVDNAVGDGTSTDIVITHNLNTRNVKVSVYENTSPYSEVIPDIEHTSLDTITLKFGSAPSNNQYSCVVIG